MTKASKVWIALSLVIAAVIAILIKVNPFQESTLSFPAQPNVLLITIDTLRADHLGCYGYSLETSPNIDSLAGRGVRFTDCTVQWPNTGPSVSSLMTGEHPKNRGLQLQWHFLPFSATTVSEVFNNAGYDTGAIVANVLVGRSFGFKQGFDYFAETWNQGGIGKARGGSFNVDSENVKEYLRGSIVADLAIRWLKKRDKKKPFFLWLHFMDPHGPYKPPQEYLSYFNGARSFEPQDIEKLPKYQLQKKAGSGEVITDLGFYKTQYDREIRNVDHEIGRLFEELLQMGLMKETLIALTADHGESLDEHDYFLDHGKMSYQCCANVPLIFAYEEVLPAGKTVSIPVGLIDVSSTLGELAGIEKPSTYEGHSLVGLIHGKKPEQSQEYIFMQSGYIVSELQRTVRHGHWKLIHVQSVRDRQQMTGSEFELYNIFKDPHERNNIAAEHPEKVSELKKVLSGWHNQYAIKGISGKQRKQIYARSQDENITNILKALGYIK